MIFIEALAERVVQKMIDRQKKAVVIFTGSDIDCAKALESVSRLREDGFTFKVLMSNSACRVLNEERIVSALQPETLWKGAPDMTPEALTKKYDTFIVPTMTVNTAAHVAGCMADSPAAATILDGMMRGKNVIINIDGCCPDNEQRVVRGFRFTPALRDRLAQNIEALRSYGAYLANSENIADKVRRATGVTFARAGESEPHASAPRHAQEMHTESRVIGARDLMCCERGGVLCVKRGSLITQLAREEAAKRGITIKITD